MWFQMPQGCGGITVERQAFDIEFKNERGECFFRAPDHFATRILAINGFRNVDRPDGAPEDLAKEDPIRDQTISELVATQTSQADEIRNLRGDIVAANSVIIALKNTNTDLNRTVEQQDAKIEELEEKLKDALEAVPVMEAKKK